MVEKILKAGKSNDGRNAEIDGALAPDDLNDLLDREGQSERKQELRDMTVAVNPSQAKSLDCRSERPCQQWSDEERGPETNPSADLEAKECARACRSLHARN